MTAAMAADDVHDDVDVAKVRRLKQYVAAFIASLGGFVFGASLGWNSSAGDTLRNVLKADSVEIGLVGGIFNAGASVGIALLPFLVKLFRRTTVMLVSLPFSVVGWLFISVGHEKTITLMLGRSICGFSGGIFCVLTPIYVAEIADKRTRAKLLMLFQLLVNCGIMYAFLMAHILNERDAVWRYSLACGATCFLIALVRLLPESPLYHLTKGDENAAKSSLRWLRNDGYKLDEELEEYRRLATIVERKRKIRRLMRNPKVIRSLITCLGVFITQQLSGIITLTFYALTIFNSGGSGELTGSQQTLVVGLVQIASCILATLLIDVLGRRTLLTLSSAFMGLFLVLLGWFCHLRDADPEYDDVFWWMPPTWLSLFFAAYNFGVGPVSCAMLGDIFPAEIKMAAAASFAAFASLISFVSTMTFGELFIRVGPANTMWLFGAFCWIGAAFCAFVVRETGRKSLVEIQEDFGVGETSNGEAGIEEGEV